MKRSFVYGAVIPAGCLTVVGKAKPFWGKPHWTGSRRRMTLRLHARVARLSDHSTWPI